jgi:NAD(P)-dependent dehydrogenase (short-subunit alcohol dehydrogenase family)
MADMTGQVALVTGGIRGIGLAIAQRLMDRGVKVAAGATRDSDTARQFLDKYTERGASVHYGNIGSSRRSSTSTAASTSWSTTPASPSTRPSAG